MSQNPHRQRAEALAKMMAKQVHGDPDRPFLPGVSAVGHVPWGDGTFPDVQRIVPVWTTYYGRALSIIDADEGFKP